MNGVRDNTVRDALQLQPTSPWQAPKVYVEVHVALNEVHYAHPTQQAHDRVHALLVQDRCSLGDYGKSKRFCSHRKS